MKLRSLYILSIVGLLLVIVVQIGGMMYAYDNTKKEAERALNECFRLAFIETVDNEINNLPFPDMTIPFYSYLSKDSIRSFEDEMFLKLSAGSFLSRRCISCRHSIRCDGEVGREETEMEKYRPDCKYPSCDGQKQAFGICTVQVCSFGKSLVE